MWSSIIRTPEFIRSFSSVSSTRPPRLIVALGNGHLNRKEESLVFLFSFSPDDQKANSSSLVPTFEMVISSTSFDSISGSCYSPSVHGLLAVQGNRWTTLCNPCTEQSIRFPSRPRHVGYDPIADQYKVFTYHLSDGCLGHLVHQVKTVGGGGGWRDVQPPIVPYYPLFFGVSITGFVYYAAHTLTQPKMQCIMCFDVATEKLTYIKVPPDAVGQKNNGMLLEYKGKLASIVAEHHHPFELFYLWVLEDIQKHQWSKTTCLVPHYVWNFVGCRKLSIQGTNKAGEIIMAPRVLSYNVEPFYIFYYNIQTHNIRRVRLQGIGDNQEFRRSYGFIGKGECYVHIAPKHVESIDYFHRES